MSTVTVTHRPDGVAVLTFDAPNSRANILSEGVWNDLRKALMPLRMRADLKGLVVSSAKPDVFIAGADLKFFAAVPKPNSPAVAQLVKLGNSTVGMFETLPFPTCAAVNGAALGGGLEVALACDARVCGPNPRAELGFPEVKLGLIPGWGGSQRLPRVTELKTAARMLLTGESVSAADAVTAKLVDRTFPDGDLIEQAAAFVRTVERGPARRSKKEPLPLLEQELLKEEVLALGPATSPAVQELMAVIVRGSEQPLPDAVAIESAAFLRLTGSDDSKARIAAFFESRKK